MVKIENYGDLSFYPPPIKGLEKLVLFPDGECKRKGVPNSSIWCFNNASFYQPWILANDVGCGMTAFVIGDVPVELSAETIAAYLADKNILGSGNHFVDICTPLFPGPSKMLLIHTDGKKRDPDAPQTFDEAQTRVKRASALRVELGHELADLIGTRANVYADWPHNTVEFEKGQVVYRKGVINVTPEKEYILPVSLGSTILVYAPNPDNMPPMNSMPHAAGRRIPRGQGKVAIEKVAEIRTLAYIPDRISDTSLRSEHPSCYNTIRSITRKFVKSMLTIGELRILAYIGKI